MEDNKLKNIIAMFESYKSAKSKTQEEWVKIRSLYEGIFWELYKSKVKDYTLTPDTNYIEYVVTAYVNSIYSAEYRPELKATDLTQNDMADVLNAFFELKWHDMCMKQRFSSWGTNVILYNMQPIKIHLSKKIDKNKVKKEVKIEDIDPFSFFADPSVNDPLEGEAIFIVKEVNIYTLLRDERFKDEVKKYLNEKKDKLFDQLQSSEVNTYGYENFHATGNKTITLIEYYIKTDTGVENGFIINREKIIYKIDNLIPSYFPFEVLYFRKPTNGPYGRSLISKIVNSYITLNLLDSIDATHPYLMQNRPKFFDLRSRINARAFIDYGNAPGATFPVMGEPSKSVYYEDIKQLPDTTNIKNRIENGIMNMTGVDPAYKGRQTNSIITTGGIQQQQARVIMLTDNGPLISLEVFVENIAKKFLDFCVEHLSEEKVDKVKLEKDSNGNWVTTQAKIAFKDIKTDNFSYKLESLPYLPMSKQSRYEALIQLYQFQGQYRFQVSLVTEDDILDELPINPIQKSKMKQRIASEKNATEAGKRRETLMTFAALFQQFKSTGMMSDEEAANEALTTMDQEAMMRQNDPSLGMNPQNMNPKGGIPI